MTRDAILFTVGALVGAVIGSAMALSWAMVG